DYINAVLLRYPITRVNLKLCLPYHVDFICRHIKPDQILSLTLSDDIDRSGQSELFFSYFHIEQFTQLRSLTLINLESNFFEIIISNLNNLHRLRSFSLVTTEYYRSIDKDYRLRFVAMKNLLSNACTNFLSQLTQLTLFNIQEMTLKPFARLRHLKISECSTKELSRICSELSILKSLDVCLQGDSITMLDISQLSALTQLRLKMDGWKNKSLLTNLVKDFLPHLVQLKHFELESDLWNSLDDGTRWANLTKSLVTFNFKFKIRFLLENLNSFRTPFWLEEKKWFVVYFNGDLCTIPRFAPVKYNTNGQSFDMSNLSSNTILHQHITEFTVLTEIFNPNQYFPNIKVLKMNCSVRMERMFNAISLNNVKHLILSSSSSIAMLLLMLPVMPLLDELTIAGRLVPILIEHLQDNIIEQIRTLNLHFCYFEKESITKMLCQHFPCIKYLNVSLINSTNDIIVFIQQLPYLVNASLGMNSLLKKEKEKNCKRLKMTIDKKYSCQVVHSSNQNTFSFVHIWLIDDYFLAHEILSSFSDVSDYVSAALLSYCEYRLDLKSIDNGQLKLIFQRIRPEKVVSLTLSRGNDGSHLSVYLLSLFRLEQFIQLRSIILIDIEYELIEPIFDDLQNLPQLCSLSFDIKNIRHRYGTLNVDFPRKLNQLKLFLSRVLPQILPRLNYIHLNNSSALESISLPHLHHLKLKKCSSHQLERIFQHAPNLRSVDVSLQIDKPFSQVILSLSRLNRLNISIDNYLVSMNQLERLLQDFPYLKHLELHASGRNLVDGQRWQNLTKNLITFNFKFNTNFDLNKRILHSFRTSYWLEEKCWFVTYQNNCIFSVPLTAPNHVSISSYTHLYSTAPDIKYANENITKLTVEGVPIDNKIRYTHIEVLDLRTSISTEELRCVIDLQQVKHLCILSLVDLLKLMPFERSLPCTCKLTVLNELTMDTVKYMRSYRFEQIRHLDINLSYENKNYIVKEIVGMFPFIEQILYRNYIHSIRDAFRFVAGFEYLRIANFYTYFIFSNIERTIDPYLEFPIDVSWQYLEENNFLYQVRSSSNCRSIGQSVKASMFQSSENIHGLQQIQYLWYQLAYFSFGNAQPSLTILANLFKGSLESLTT
ncbi:unnamed protein product, partial [Rotaria socialis]